MKRLTMDHWRRVFKKQISEVKPNDIWRLTMDRRLDFHSVEPGWMEIFQEHAHGRFTCSGCYHSWYSHQVLILFHMQWESSERRGHIKMKRFGQRCHECFLDTYEEPQFSEDDVEEILRDLVLDIREICYGEQVDRSQLSKVVCHQGGPHKREFCEGCQLGIHQGQPRRANQAEHHGKAQNTGFLAAIIQRETPTPSFTRASTPTFTCSSVRSFTSFLSPLSTGSSASSLTRSSDPTQSSNYCICFTVVAIIVIFLMAVIIFIAYMSQWF